jgi:hypothetical protein
MKNGVRKMNVFIESIRKLMGWCPNSKMHETQHSIHPEHFEASNQSRGKDAGNSPVLPSGWWNKRHNRTLVYSGLTLFSIFLIGFLGINFWDEGFIFGFIIGGIFNSLLCVWDWRFLNGMKTFKKMRPMNKKSTSPKMRVVTSILSLILLYLIFSQFGLESFLSFIAAFCLVALVYYFELDWMHPLIVLLSIGSMSGFKHILTFISGFCLTAFLLYLTAIYWEKKNKKIVFIHGRNMPEIYIVSEGAE